MIEHTVAQATLFDEDSNAVTVDDIVRNGPPVVAPPASGLNYGSARAHTFRYLKLHGSVDAYWVPDDAVGTSIGRWRSEAGWGRQVEPSADRRVEMLPDREPFIVPPSAAKSSFYQNPLTRQLWRLAARAVEESDEVALVGYSLPLTDLVTSGMLRDRLNANSRGRVVVVNLDPDPVVSALADLGVDMDRVSAIGGTDACEQFTDAMEDFEPAWAWPTSVHHDDNTPVVVGAHSHVQARATQIRSVSADGTVELDVDTDVSSPGSPIVTLGDVLRVVSDRPRRVRVRWPDGRSSGVAATKLIPDLSGTRASAVLLVPTATPLLHES